MWTQFLVIASRAVSIRRVLGRWKRSVSALWPRLLQGQQPRCGRQTWPVSALPSAPYHGGHRISLPAELYTGWDQSYSCVDYTHTSNMSECDVIMPRPVGGRHSVLSDVCLSLHLCAYFLRSLFVHTSCLTYNPRGGTCHPLRKIFFMT